MSNRKPVQVKPEALIQDDHLLYPIRRGKVARKDVEAIVPTRKRSAYGHLHKNWMGAGMLAHTLKMVFTSDEQMWADEREALKSKGFVKRPQELDFDILAIVEASFPEVISIEDVARRLNREASVITARLTYLREFVALMCGVNVLRDGKGNIGIANPALWLEWHNRMAKQANGIRESLERHGLNLTNVVQHQLTVKEELPSIQPFILELPQKAEGVAHD